VSPGAAERLDRRLQKEDRHTVDLIDKLDVFLADMQVISDRLIAKLDEHEERERDAGD
jgi:hypothetical protein